MTNARHEVYPGGPLCQPNCPGPSSMYHDGYADGYENAESAGYDAGVRAMAEADLADRSAEDALREAQATIEAMSGDAADLHDLLDEAAALRTALAHAYVRVHDSGCGICDAGRALLTSEHELPSRSRLLAGWDASAEDALRHIILNGGLRLPGFDHWRERSSSKPSDPDDVRWDCSCGYAGSPETVQRHWQAMLGGYRRG